MRLIELSPEWLQPSEKDTTPNIQRYIDFRCPGCPDEPMEGYMELRCRIIIPLTSDGHWGWNGEEDFDKLTITPSIWHHCKSDPHFFIRAGQIQFA